jgi:NitT/TauT family transport system substrate-binding protein
MDRRRMLQGATCAMGAWTTTPSLAAPERPKVTVAVGGRTLIVYLPFMLAWSRGAFKRQGLDVEITDFSGGTKALEALVGGSADFVSGAYEHVILLGLKGIRLKAITLQDESFGLVVAVQKSKASLYKSAADLKGRIIGVTSPGSASSNGLKLLLAKAGLRESDVSVIGVGAGAAAVAAMTSGRLDAISNFDPVISQLERAEAIHPLIDTRNEQDLKTLYGGPIAASSVYTTEAFRRRNPTTAQAVANAMAETLAWLRKAATDDVVASVPPEFYGNDRAFYAQVIAKNRTRFSADGLITPAKAEATWRALGDIDPRQQSTKLDLKDTFDMSFMEAAAKGL